jgi:transcription elongation GreA/GreB family factor
MPELTDAPRHEAKLAELRALLQACRFEQLESAFMDLLEAPELSSEVLEALIEIGEKLLEAGEGPRAGAVMELLLPAARSLEGSLDLQLRIYELLVRVFPQKREYRVLFLEAFESLHGPTSAERAFLAASGLQEAASPVAALDRLRHLLKFRAGACVYHAAGWGVGEVLSVDPFLKQIRVDLAQKKDHRIAIHAVDSILVPLPEDSFRAMLHRGGEGLRRLAREEASALIDKLLECFGSPLALKEVKERLVPAVIPVAEWTRWWNQTKAQLRSSGFYRVGDRAPYHIERLESAVSYDDDLLRRYQRAAWKEARQIARLVGRGGGEAFPRAWPGIQEDLLRQLAQGAPPARVIECGALLLRMEPEGEAAAEVAGLLARLAPEQILAGLEELSAGEEQKRVLEGVVAARAQDGFDVVKKAFAGRSDSLREAAASLLEEREPAKLRSLAEEFCRSPRMAPAAFCWLLERRIDGESGLAHEALGERSPRDLLVLLLDFMDHLIHLEQRGGRNAVKDLFRRLEALLSRGGKGLFFEEGLKEMSSAERQEVHTRLVRCASWVPQGCTRYQDIIAVLEPELLRSAKRPIWEDEGVIYVTEAGLRRKKDEFRELMEVKLPKNFEAIGKAASFGDLSENSEYTSALEERDHLTKRAARIKDELDKARIIGPELAKAGQAGPGSRIRVVSLESGEETTYSILGPWDGTPEEGVLSYLSPLGKVFLGKKEGDEFEADLPGGKRSFRVLEVRSHFA